MDKKKLTSINYIIAGILFCIAAALHGSMAFYGCGICFDGIIKENVDQKRNSVPLFLICKFLTNSF